MSKRVLEILFDSRLKVKILKYLFRNSGDSFTVRNIAKHVQEKTPTVRHEINKLVDIGLLKTQK